MLDREIRLFGQPFELVGLPELARTHSEIHRIQGLREIGPRTLVGRLLQEAQGPQGELLRQMQAVLHALRTGLVRLPDEGPQ